MIVKDRLFIEGQWAEPLGSDVLEVTEAATGEVLGHVPEATTGDVDRSVSAARAAFDGGPWSHSSAVERADVMDALSAELKERAGEIAELITRENGCPAAISTRLQVFGATTVLDYYANLARSYDFEEQRDGIMGKVIVRREPVGVVGAIVPWNVPLFITLSKLGPALAAGCTMVLKPAPETALDAYLLGECAEAAGVPDGVLNIIAADREVGEHLVTHPGVDKISFTGSTTAGRRIASLCGEQLRRCTLELGGKSAAIILDDADLSAVVDPLLLGGTFINNGQACVAQSRVLVSRQRYTEVVDAISERAASLVVGDPLDPATEVGPLVARRQHERVLGYIETGKQEGASVITGGGIPAGADRGWYVQPTVFAEVDNTMRIAREEIFGPVVVVIPYDDVDDAVAIANDSPYGLAGSVWTADWDSGLDVARRVRTGIFGINGMGMDFGAPFGGFKQSGIGRELGPEGLQSYLEHKNISLNGGTPVVAS